MDNEIKNNELKNEVFEEKANEEIKEEIKKDVSDIKDEVSQTQSEQPKDDKPQDLIEITKPDNDDEPFDKAIESARAVLYKDYQKSRTISNILTCVVLAVGLGGVLLITRQNMVMTIIGWVLIGLTIIGLLVYYALNKNKFPNKTREYIIYITTTINKNLFQDESYTEVFTDLNEKFDITSVIGDGVYESIGSAQSRNIVRGKFNGKEFMYAEVALAKSGATKKEGPVFVGKYVSFPNNLQMKNRIVVNLKNGEKSLDLPTAVSDLTAHVDNSALAVYAIKDVDFKNVLGEKFYDNFLNKLAIRGCLINVNLVVWAGRSAVYFSYDDSAMGLPFDKPMVKESYEQMADDLLNAFTLLDKIGK